MDFLFKRIDSAILRGKVRVFLDLYRSRSELAAQQRDLETAYRELEATYRDLKATQGQLIQSAKMASLGELVAGIAHEINNPLSFVVSHLGTAQKSLALVETEHGTAWSEASTQHWNRARSRLHELAVGLDRIRELVIKLRTFSRLDEGERKQLNLRECIESVGMILKHRMKDRIVVDLLLGVSEEIGVSDTGLGYRKKFASGSSSRSSRPSQAVRAPVSDSRSLIRSSKNTGARSKSTAPRAAARP